jgi:hypothetical protein
MPSKDEHESSTVLTCWKDIARYLGKGVRTVQRWEQDLALPVRRPHNKGPKGPVAARPADLDKWLSVNWSERRSADGATTTLPLPVAGQLENPLILTARQLRDENQVLLAGLVKSIEQLHRTCSVFELSKPQVKES